MHQFPIVLIPPAIQQASSAQPPVPTFTEPLPQQPGREPEKVNATAIAVEATAAIVPSAAIASQGGTAPGLLLFLVAAGAIAAQAWRQITTYPQRQKKHRHQVAEYRRKLEEHNQKKRQHEEEVRAARSPERGAEFQYKLLLQVISQTVPHDGDNSRAPQGPSEARFVSCLKRYFPNKIQTRLKVQNPSYSEGYHYTPDFAYIDEDLNLHIDIEIDEPYNKKGEPIHYVELETQWKRDEHFLSRGWIVIRFSEEQVVRWPQSCCKTVAQAIAEVMGNSSMLNQFASVSALQPMEQWTEEEARQMAASGYRDKYLSNTLENARTLTDVTREAQIKSRVASIGTGKKAHHGVRDEIWAAYKAGDTEKAKEAEEVLRRLEKRGTNQHVKPGYTDRLLEKIKKTLK